MKKISNKYVFFTACLFVSLEFFAQVTPPPPVPPPPGLPISDGLLALCVIGLLFGLYKIYISIIKKKRSI